MAKLFWIKNPVLRILAGLFMVMLGVAVFFEACFAIGFVLQKIGLDYLKNAYGHTQIFDLGFVTLLGLGVIGVSLGCSLWIGDELFNHVQDKKKEGETGG